MWTLSSDSSVAASTFYWKQVESARRERILKDEAKKVIEEREAPQSKD